MPKDVEMHLDASEHQALGTATPTRPLMVVTDLAPKAGDTLICWGPDDAYTFATVLGAKRMEWDTVLALSKKR